MVAALAAVDMSNTGAFPVDELESVSTLDKAQVQALLAGLSQEVAIIQGPPGTGDYTG